MAILHLTLKLSLLSHSYLYLSKTEPYFLLTVMMIKMSMQSSFSWKIVHSCLFILWSFSSTDAQKPFISPSLAHAHTQTQGPGSQDITHCFDGFGSDIWVSLRVRSSKNFSYPKGRVSADVTLFYTGGTLNSYSQTECKLIYFFHRHLLI